MRHRSLSALLGKGRSGRRWLLVLALLATVAAACTPPLIPPAPLRFYALNLPTTPAPADLDGQPAAGVFRSVRLLLDDRPLARSHTIVGDTEKGQHLGPGHSLGMAFQAPRAFYGVAVSLSRVGPGPGSARITLRRGGRRGSVIAARDYAAVPQRSWAELRTGLEPPGLYYVEVSNTSGDGLFWRGHSLGSSDNLWQEYQEAGVPFKLPRTLDDIPVYDGSSLGILVNAQVERIYILGGRSSYDYGIAHWGDYEARADSSDRQFIGDRVGDLEVIYTDGTTDRVPLILGFNQWWWTPWGDTAYGGPFLEPFFTTPRPLISSLHIYSLGNVPISPSFWVYQTQKKKIARLRLVDNPLIQGFPLVTAITLEARYGGPNATPLPSPPAHAQLSSWLLEHTITPDMIATSAYEGPLLALRSFLYTEPSDIPTSLPIEHLEGQRGPLLRFDGAPSAAILSNVFSYGVRDLLSKIDADGTFHTSTKDAPNFSLYSGIGSWRNGVGYFYNQAWSRDMGRALLELVRLGFLDEVEAALSFAGRHLYDLTNNYPQVSRQGEQIPPHWGTVLGTLNVIDIDGMGDDNQENDGHGLLLLTYLRTWQARGRDAAWADARWQIIKDAADWYCFQLENPAFSRAASVLYTEGEAANDGGYDVYSNVIAAEALAGAAELARTLGQITTAQHWDSCSATLWSGLQRDLTDGDPRYGVTWRPVSWGWGYGHESLAPALLAADRTGYVLDAASTLTITRQTYRRQVELLSGFRSGRVMGYGQAFLTQAALLLDDMAGASDALDTMASFIYDGDVGTYLTPEGVALHPSGGYWYRTGDLGNAMQEAEVLKTLALIAGVDDLAGQSVQLVPRLPLRWSGMTVTGYPVTVNGRRTQIDYKLKRESRRLSMEISASAPAPPLSVRLGPFPAEALPRATVNSVAQTGALVASGGWRWLWLHNLPGAGKIQIEAVW